MELKPTRISVAMRAFVFQACCRSDPLVDFSLTTDTLTFQNAAVESGVAKAPSGYAASWFTFDNNTHATQPLGETKGASGKLPAPAGLPSAPGLDQFGRVTASTQSTANAYQGTFTSYSFAYTYNLVGWLTSETYPSLKAVNYTYDAAGRPTKASSPPALDFGRNVVYAPNSAMEQLKLGNNLYEQNCYNNRLQFAPKAPGDGPAV